MNENKGPVMVLCCRACDDPIALGTRPVAVACGTPCATTPKRVRKNEQRDSWLCEEYYGGGMTYTEIAEKYGLGVDVAKRIIDGF